MNLPFITKDDKCMVSNQIRNSNTLTNHTGGGGGEGVETKTKQMKKEKKEFAFSECEMV